MEFKSTKSSANSKSDKSIKLEKGELFEGVGEGGLFEGGSSSSSDSVVIFLFFFFLLKEEEGRDRREGTEEEGEEELQTFSLFNFCKSKR